MSLTLAVLLILSALGLNSQSLDAPFGKAERRHIPNPCQTMIKPAAGGILVWSPTGKQYLVNQPDASGIYQIYVGTAGGNLACISCTQVSTGPAPNLHKMQPRWYPTGDWIVLAVEMSNFQPPALATPQLILGWLQSGIWCNIWITKPDGSQWFQLSNFGQQQTADGFTGVAFTSDGSTAVWAQIINSNFLEYLFGQWRLIQADFQVNGGVPSFSNLRDITPAGANWIEPGNFAPGSHSLLITSDIGLTDPQGMDQFTLDIDTGDVVNLTNTPTIWDEHGIFSPDGQRIIWMSSYPYQNVPNSGTVLGLETEFMLMDREGKHWTQLTHFNTPGYPESNPPGQRTVAAVGAWNLKATAISALNLIFPNYQTWSINFQGDCVDGPRPDARNFPFSIRR